MFTILLKRLFMRKKFKKDVYKRQAIMRAHHYFLCPADIHPAVIVDISVLDEIAEQSIIAYDVVFSL